VGYAAVGFTPGGENPTRRFLVPFEEAKRAKMEARRSGESAYVRLARETLEAYVKTGRIPAMPAPAANPKQTTDLTQILPAAHSDGDTGDTRATFTHANWPEEMFTQRAGTFVSIKKDGKLRGCIGTTEPYRPNIAEEIIGNAISAGTRDPRFDTITADELPELVYSVDILSPAEAIDSPADLDVRRYGVIVANGHKRGLLLPNLDGVDTIKQQIDIARQKAGLAAGEKYSLMRFEVVRYK
jgi:AmmeMemoRadiSam system protein A